MEIVWITGRDLKLDLASTTEIGLIEGLIKENISINVFSTTMDIRDNDFEHIRFRKIRFKGLETISGGFFLAKKLRKGTKILNLADCIIVDWCYIPSIISELRKIDKPWFIIDRGPPVYNSFLTKIQKRIWKRAWAIASDYATGSFVVSEKHKELVKRIDSNIHPHVLNAGTDLDDFDQDEKIIQNCVRIAYSGRIDKNRGIESIITLSKNLERENISHEINIMGEGDYVGRVKNFADSSDSFIYHGKITRDAVYEILKNTHFGIMPMPDKTVWRTASPIKLTEYMASGLLIIGQDHPGNRISENEVWSFLIEGTDWPDKTPLIINNILEKGNFIELSDLSRKSAKNYDWQIITQKMIKYINNQIKNE
ncbi:MAG: hypothetical protein CMA42_05830 [Euryarchaeota archaeon]|nr:hypothetical protein [Euryarchaeota archaeon]